MLFPSPPSRETNDSGFFLFLHAFRVRVVCVTMCVGKSCVTKVCIVSCVSKLCVRKCGKSCV